MNTQNKLFRCAALPMAALALIASATVATAREPFTKDELKAMDDKLTASAKRGYDMWYGARADMSNNGLACANCHPDSAATNPHTFPKFMPQVDRVIAFREMVNWCIENPQGGKAFPLNSDELTALEAYAFYLYRGRPIEPGLATRQTSSIPVKSGYGYGRKPSGVGQEK